MKEFDLISRFFAPLAEGYPGAMGLKDDAAVVATAAGADLVITKDIIVEGIHFPVGEDPETIARRLLRVNLSDLAAKGARPEGYLVGGVFPRTTDEGWFTKFAEGLRRDQEEFGVFLAGGDTVATDGPLTLSLTAFGQVMKGGALLRSGAGRGDLVFVSGTIGDAVLGLMVLQDDLEVADTGDRDYLVRRFRLPEPRVGLGPRLAGLASAAADVSDGLVADLGHICEASGVGARIDASAVPLSAAARAVVERAARDTAGGELLAKLLGGGDDYEIVFTVPPDRASAVISVAEECGIPLSRIGRVTSGGAVSVLDGAGREIEVPSAGYDHFQG